MASPGETYEQLRQAWTQGDAQAATALYAPDAVWYDSDNRAHRGQEDIRDHLRGQFATGGPVQFTVKRQVASDGTTLLAEWTSASEEGGRRSTGLPGATVIEVGSDGIVYHRDYR